MEISDRWKIAGLWVAVASVLLGSSTWATFQTWPDSLDRIWTPSHAAPAVSPLATPGSSSGADEHTQAAAMASLLQRMKTTRGEIPDSLGRCDAVGVDVDALQQVINERSDQVRQAAYLSADRMTGGGGLKAALQAMAQTSLDADQEYLNWAQAATASGDCRDVTDGGTIGQANQDAADAKRGFVALWNPYAARLGLTHYVWNDF